MKKISCFIITLIFLSMLNSCVSTSSSNFKLQQERLISGQKDKAIKTDFVISIYYYSSREDCAEHLRAELEKNGHIVNLFTGDHLNKDKVITNSYMYSGRKNMDQALQLRKIVEANLSERFAMHISDNEKTIKIALISIKHHIPKQI